MLRCKKCLEEMKLIDLSNQANGFIHVHYAYNLSPIFEFYFIDEHADQLDLEDLYEST